MLNRAVTCPSGWTNGSTKCYLFTGLSRSWSDAKQYCEELDGVTIGGQTRYPSLLTLDSDNETVTFTSLRTHTMNYWINCQDMQVQRTFVCETTRDGQVSSYRSKCAQRRVSQIVKIEARIHSPPVPDLGKVTAVHKSCNDIHNSSWH